jgi:hypothetical protein
MSPATTERRCRKREDKPGEEEEEEEEEERLAELETTMEMGAEVESCRRGELVGAEGLEIERSRRTRAVGSSFTAALNSRSSTAISIHPASGGECLERTAAAAANTEDLARGLQEAACLLGLLVQLVFMRHLLVQQKLLPSRSLQLFL